ncbi:Subtilase family protein [Daejeonella rubra]|uniref:Subtilase family protein n=1 Tax=Daejeonella rubra TaxID=990371 RepID=A0A1G9NHM1_9SPHI|nr:S8 family peptidase [Daejeonella rubra]SDL85884.1 Subtilase family protein [Daejeonella rubra]
MAEFPHLPLVQTITGVHKPPKGGGSNDLDPRTSNNLANRGQHGQNLINITTGLKDDRNKVIDERRAAGLPDLPGQDAIPIFLQVDTSLFNIESLRSMGIEIIAEELDGFIIGASSDGFTSLHDKIDKFINEQGKFKNQAAQLWQIVAGNQWRAQQILSEDLYEKWPNIADDDTFVVDVSVACYIAKPPQPVMDEDETEQHYQVRLARWETKVQEIELQKSDLADERQESIQEFLSVYSADINPESVQFDDSFCFRVTLPGQALKDFVLNYPYVFEVIEYTEVDAPLIIDGEVVENDLDIIAPQANAPKICIIDSGIQENHRLIAPALLTGESMNYDPFDATTADLVPQGGHGTRVTGAVLYGEDIPAQGTHQLHCFILNARVLNRDNMMSSQLYPPALMGDIVYNFDSSKIFNLSINTTIPCRLVHMSPWAAAIDQLSHEEEVLFIVSAGNLKKTTGVVTNPGIMEHMAAGRSYPQYLLEASCRIADPAQSKFAITVGSVCLGDFEDLDKISFGQRDTISSFSRTGLGLWGGIKPEVVEYGGDWVREKLGTNLSYENSINPLLVRAGGTGVDRGTVGTSFTAPKVTHIASKLQAAFPNESALLYKTLIVQSARLPQNLFRTPTLPVMRMFGYGIPNLNRATENSERRVTLVESATVKPGVANLYTINIPQELRRPGEDFDILIEVTLCYTAKPRRTRRRTQSYLSSWLSWESSKIGELYEPFKARVLKHMEDPEADAAEDNSSIKWSIWSNPIWGTVKGLKRQDSATQKDWVVVKSNTLPEQLSFAVAGHKGWEKDLSEEVPFSFAVSLEVLDGELEIYERIRAVNQIEVEQQIQATV